MTNCIMKTLAIATLLLISHIARAQVIISATQVCYGLPTTLTNQSNIPHTASVDWGLANNGFFNSASGNVISYTFPAADSFYVQLRITDSSGTVYYSALYPVVVYPIPVAAFALAGPCLGSSTAFTGLSSIADASALTYAWSFMDNGMTNSTTANAATTYAAAGPYTVLLTTTSAHGCADSIAHAITITAPPVAGFTYDSGCAHSPVLFRNTSAYPGNPLNQAVWNFGDSDLSFSGDTVYHTYLKGDSFFVQLKVIDTSGCTDSVSRLVVLDPAVSYTDSLTNGAQFYTGQSTTAIISGTFASIVWSDSTTADTHLFSMAGSYSFTVFNSLGCSAAGSIDLTTVAAPAQVGQANDFLTPNGDGRNDVLSFPNLDAFVPCQLKVYDERGLMVYSNANYQNDWGGNGANAGPYYYFLSCKDTGEVKGVTNLVH
jgi:gliding motility-associated-like protein